MSKGKDAEGQKNKTESNSKDPNIDLPPIPKGAITHNRDKNGNPTNIGRPRKPIDWDEFEKLCMILCTEEEIAGWFGVTTFTLNERVKERYGMTFFEFWKQKGATGKISIRRKQFQTAMGGNVPLLIWLGKQWLNQLDKQENNIQLQEIKLKYNLGEKTNKED